MKNYYFVDDASEVIIIVNAKDVDHAWKKFRAIVEVEEWELYQRVDDIRPYINLKFSI